MSEKKLIIDKDLSGAGETIRVFVCEDSPIQIKKTLVWSHSAIEGPLDIDDLADTVASVIRSEIDW